MTIDTKIFCHKYFDNIRYMANGPPLADVRQARHAPEFKAPNQFTPFSPEMLKNASTMTRPPESEAVTMIEPSKYQEDPTVSISPEDEALTK